MPIIVDLLYRECCRARIAEMRKQLMLWPSRSVVREESCETEHFNKGDDKGGPGYSQDWDDHTEIHR